MSQKLLNCYAPDAFIELEMSPPISPSLTPLASRFRGFRRLDSGRSAAVDWQ